MDAREHRESRLSSPSVTVSSSLPTRGVGDAVLIVPVISDDDTPKVLAAEPYLDAEAVDEIEAGLRALGATGGAEQLHRLPVAALPVASVLPSAWAPPATSGRRI